MATLVEIHPEIGQVAESDVLSGAGCAALAAERPQLVVTNLMVASAMLNCLWAVTEQGSGSLLQDLKQLSQTRSTNPFRPGSGIRSSSTTSRPSGVGAAIDEQPAAARALDQDRIACVQELRRDRQTAVGYSCK
jgi:hypothetical protein